MVAALDLATGKRTIGSANANAGGFQTPSNASSNG
jgi:hypothetical protein